MQRGTGSSSLVFITALLVAIFTFSFHPATTIAQTVYGQHGLVVTPSADTHTNGNFAVGSYFRSFYFDERRYDVMPISLTTGISPVLEIGFAFPGIWGSQLLSRNYEHATQISLKYRFLGDPEDTFRYAVAGELYRPVFQGPQAAAYNDEVVIGSDVIASMRITDRWGATASAGFTLGGNSSVSDNIRFGLGAEKKIIPPLRALSDMRVILDTKDMGNSSVELYTGLRYFFRDFLNVTAVGSIGIADNDYNWQYLIGLGFNSNVFIYDRNDGTELLPPSLESLGMEIKPVQPQPKPQPPQPPLVPRPPVEMNSKPFKSDIVSRIFYDYNDIDYNPYESHAFGKAITFLEQVDKGRNLLLVGHTDKVGSSRFNLVLGMTRSANTAVHILNAIDTDETQIFVSSRGEYDLKKPDRAQYVNQLNRKVDIVSLSPLKIGNRIVTGYDQTWNVTSDEDISSFRRRHGWTWLTDNETANINTVAAEVAELDTNQIILIESQLSDDVNGSYVFVKAVRTWIQFVMSTGIDPERVFIHMTDAEIDFAAVDTETRSYVAVKAVDIEQNGGTKSEFTGTLTSDSLDRVEYRLVGVVTDRYQYFTSYGDLVTDLHEIDPEQGVIKTFERDKPVNVAMTFARNVASDQEFEVLMYTMDGELVQRSPIVRNYTLPYWNKRISDEILLDGEVSEFQTPVRIVLARSDVLVAKNSE